MDGVFQETGEESCQSICDAVNATVMAGTIAGPSDPHLNGTFTCITAVVDGQCSGITFFVNPSMDGSVDILVSNSVASECTAGKVQSKKVRSALCPCSCCHPPTIIALLDLVLVSTVLTTLDSMFVCNSLKQLQVVEYTVYCSIKQC